MSAEFLKLEAFFREFSETQSNIAFQPILHFFALMSACNSFLLKSSLSTKLARSSLYAGSAPIALTDPASKKLPSLTQRESIGSELDHSLRGTNNIKLEALKPFNGVLRPFPGCQTTHEFSNILIPCCPQLRRRRRCLLSRLTIDVDITVCFKRSTRTRD